jgi:hypothetical protein
MARNSRFPIRPHSPVSNALMYFIMLESKPKKSAGDPSKPTIRTVAGLANKKANMIIVKRGPEDVQSFPASISEALNTRSR